MACCVAAQPRVSSGQTGNQSMKYEKTVARLIPNNMTTRNVSSKNIVFDELTDMADKVTGTDITYFGFCKVADFLA